VLLSDDDNLTDTVGTPAFTAPEICTGLLLFSLSAIHLISGKKQ
jgi:hypothetical protein